MHVVESQVSNEIYILYDCIRLNLMRVMYDANRIYASTAQYILLHMQIQYSVYKAIRQHASICRTLSFSPKQTEWEPLRTASRHGMRFLNACCLALPEQPARLRSAVPMLNYGSASNLWNWNPKVWWTALKPHDFWTFDPFDWHNCNFCDQLFRTRFQGTRWTSLPKWAAKSFGRTTGTWSSWSCCKMMGQWWVNVFQQWQDVQLTCTFIRSPSMLLLRRPPPGTYQVVKWYKWNMNEHDINGNPILVQTIETILGLKNLHAVSQVYHNSRYIQSNSLGTISSVVRPSIIWYIRQA